jgi:hypothetical protein
VNRSFQRRFIKHLIDIPLCEYFIELAYVIRTRKLMNKRSRVLPRLKFFPVQFSEESMTFDIVGAVLISKSLAWLLFKELKNEISGVAANLEKEMRKTFNMFHIHRASDTYRTRDVRRLAQNPFDECFIVSTVKKWCFSGKHLDQENANTPPVCAGSISLVLCHHNLGRLWKSYQSIRVQF